MAEAPSQGAPRGTGGASIFDTIRGQLSFWTPVSWFLLMAAAMDTYVLILFGDEETFLQQYTWVINLPFVYDFIVPGFKGWAIALTPIFTGFFVGFAVESRRESESIKPYMFTSLAITLMAILEVIGIMLLPALLNWTSGADDFMLKGVVYLIVMAMLFFPLTFIGTFLGAITVSY